MNHKEFRSKARKCPHRDTGPNSDWHTCDHKDNPTVIRSCAIRHCPHCNVLKPLTWEKWRCEYIGY